MDRHTFTNQGNGGQHHPTDTSSLAQWFATPAGRLILEWELAQFDHAVEDVFGFRAVQFGLPEIDFLRQNRIAHRFALGLESHASLIADPLQLPLASHSLDLVVMPHVLESHNDPHNVLREVERVLRPEGQLVIAGFNTLSLWRMRQIFAGKDPGAPWDGTFIGLLRLRDWLKLLGFELNGGKFGCYAPPFTQEKWIRRFEFMEQAGARWWPIMGGIYVIRAIKRAPGSIMITPAWRRERARRRALRPAIQGSGSASGMAGRKESIDD